MIARTPYPKRVAWYGVILGVLLAVLMAPMALAQYSEAPMLAAKVQRGELPPVAERLPVNPKVVPPFDEIGRYGGTMRRGFSGHGDNGIWYRVHHDQLLDWTLDGRVEPNLVERWEVNGDFTEYVFHLREGLKWSDGHPFTADDVMFWFHHYLADPEWGTGIPADRFFAGGEPMVWEKISDLSFRVRAAAPAPLLPMNIARHWGGTHLPKHYLAQFHYKYNDAIKPGDSAAFQNFQAAIHFANPDLPRAGAWYITSYDRQRILAERNPYYHKVDTAGQQLPYIDRIEMTQGSAEVLNLRAIAGDFDFQVRHMVFSNYPALVSNADNGGYDVYLWTGEFGAMPNFYFNWFVEDDELRELFRTPKFRQALSLAINREEINELVYFGQGVPRQTAVSSLNPLFEERYARAWADYDPQRALQMLAELGIRDRNGDGFLHLPSGRRLELLLKAYAEHNMALAFPVVELVVDQWNQIGIAAAVRVYERTAHQREMATNNSQIVPDVGATAIPELYSEPWFPITQGQLGGFALLHGRWVQTGGREGVEPEGIFAELYEIYQKIATVSDEDRVPLLKRVFDLQAETLYQGIGAVGEVPQVAIVNKKLRNVPRNLIYTVAHLAPKNGFPEQWFFAAP